MKTIKFRAWDRLNKTILDNVQDTQFDSFLHGDGFEVMQFTGLLDKNKTPIYEGDIVRFSDKREWYRNNLFSMWIEGKTEEEKQLWLDTHPYELREVKIPDFYEEFSKLDLCTAWEVIGDIYSTPELLK